MQIQPVFTNKDFKLKKNLPLLSPKTDDSLVWKPEIVLNQSLFWGNIINFGGQEKAVSKVGIKKFCSFIQNEDLIVCTNPQYFYMANTLPVVKKHIIMNIYKEAYKAIVN